MYNFNKWENLGQSLIKNKKSTGLSTKLKQHQN